MEVWILLAAAGSGYLARCWQNAHKTKGAATKEDDPHLDGNTGPSSRGKYRHFSTTSRRQVGKTLSNKGIHHWGRLSSKSLQVGESSALGNEIDGKSEERGNTPDTINFSDARARESNHGIDNKFQMPSFDKAERTDKDRNEVDEAELQVQPGKGKTLLFVSQREPGRVIHGETQSASTVASQISLDESVETWEDVAAEKCCSGQFLPGQKHSESLPEGRISEEKCSEACLVGQCSNSLENFSEEESSLASLAGQPCGLQQNFIEGQSGNGTGETPQEEYLNDGLNGLLVQAAEGQCLTEGSCPLLLRSLSGKRSNDLRNEESQKGAGLLQDGFSGKRMKDARERTDNQEEETVFGGEVMPGFWDVSQGVFVLDAHDFIMQQGGEARSKGRASRKVKTPNKYGRGRGSMNRRTSLTTTSKPMSSLESCLSAQLADENYNQGRTGIFFPLFSPPVTDQGEQPVRTVGRTLGDPLSGLVETRKFSNKDEVILSQVDSAIGLPPLSKRFSVRSSMNRKKKTKSTTVRPSKLERVCVPSGGYQNSVCFKSAQSIPTDWKEFGTRRGGENQGATFRLDALNKESSCLQELTGTSLEGLLFNFGVGVGMMYTIMSNRQEVEKLTDLLREAESLIKDLEEELEARDVLGPEGDTSMKTGDVGDVTAQQSQTLLSNTLKKVRSATQSLNSMRLSLTEDFGPTLRMEHMQSEDMAKLEAELEAELERMELDLNDGSVAKHQRRFSGLSEFDADIIASLVQGELTVKGLPNEIEVESEEDGSDSTHEDMQVGNYAVSPRELAKRLHEVLEARQQEHIAELEAELSLISSKLKVKEEELQWWKDKSQHLTPGTSSGAGGGSFSELHHTDHCDPDSNISPKELSETQVASGRQVDRKLLLSPSNEHSPNPSPVSPEISGDFLIHERKNAALSMPFRSHKGPKTGNLKKNPVFITLAGEALAAYNEACDEFSKVLSDSEMGAHPVDSSCGKDVYSEHDFLEEMRISTISDERSHDHDLVHSGMSGNWEQLDLVSLAEDFYRGDDSELMVDISTFRSAQSKHKGFAQRRNSHSKGMISSHPEPEQSLTCLKAMDLSDDTVNDTSGSTPCSVKFMDTSTSATCQSDDQIRAKAETFACGNSSLSSNGNEETLSHAGANTPVVSSQEGKQPFCCGQGVSQTRSFQSSEQCVGLTSNQGDRIALEDCENTSDSDEQLGQLLIKRIVEKTRRGLPIVQDAQTVLASFESSEIPLSSDRSNVKDKSAVASMPEEDLIPWQVELSGQTEVRVPHASPSFTGSRTVEQGFLESMQPWNGLGNISTIGKVQQNRGTPGSPLIEPPLERWQSSFAESSKDVQRGYRSVYESVSQQLVNGCTSSSEEREPKARTRQDNVYGISNNDRQRTSTSQTGLSHGVGRNKKR